MLMAGSVGKNKGCADKGQSMLRPYGEEASPRPRCKTGTWGTRQEKAEKNRDNKAGVGCV